MARGTISVQTISRSGLEPSYASASADGDAFANNGRTFLHIKNTGTEKTVTIVTPNTVDGLAISDRTVTVDATTGDVMVGPFPTNIYNQSDDTVYVNYSSETDVTVAAIVI